MSLESKIEKLTAAIEKLNSNLEKSGVQLELDLPLPEGPKTKEDKPKSKKAEPEQEATKEVTHEDLKQLCLAKVRENKSFKEDLKAYLDNEFGVKKTGDVPDDKVAEAYAKIESGEL